MPTRQRTRTSRDSALPPLAEVGDGSIPEALPEVTLPSDPLPAMSREARIAAIAYQRAERRGFEPGYELDDWLAAEREVNAGPGEASSTEQLLNDLSATEH